MLMPVFKQPEAGFLNVPADWNGEIEYGQNAGPLCVSVEVAEDGGRDGREPGLPEADGGPEGQERPVAGHEGGRQGAEAPGADAGNHDPLAGVAVAQVAEERRRGEVADDEGRLEEAALPSLQVKVCDDLGKDAWPKKRRIFRPDQQKKCM